MSSPSIAAVFLMLAASLPSGHAQGTAKFQPRKTWTFATDGVSFSNEFSGARLDGVTRTGEFAYQLAIRPETSPVNNSTWFAFRVGSKLPQKLELTLVYTGGSHRYQPKVTTDGAAWTLVRGVDVAKGRKQASFSLETSPENRVVAGQPIITVDEQMAWTRGLTSHPFVTQREFGRSVQGRALPVLETHTAPAATARTLILMTGQHPPEFTGVLAFRNFVASVLADTPLAVEFRRHFNLAIFPLMNPDGWYHGHWRCNANGIDSNRAWIGDGLKTVPEVQQAIAVLRKIPNPVMFIDFHSTDFNVLYTGPDDDQEPRFLVPEFQAALARRVPQFAGKRETSHSTDGSPSRSWGTRELKVPSITWEFADIASPERLAAAPAAGAEELMRLLLRLGHDDTTPLARYDFEPSAAPGADSAGQRTAQVAGSPASLPQSAFGSAALSFAPTASHLSIPDFDYGSKGSTLSLWFRMDRSSLADGDFTSLVSHGDLTRPGNLNLFHRRSSSQLSVRTCDANDNPNAGDIDLPDALVLDGKWHHLGVVVRPGEGTSVYLDGIGRGAKPCGNDGLNPEGPIFLGISQDGAATRYKGALDDVRFYGSPLTPYDLTTLRFPEVPAS
ncbi:hypothetical protein HQ447_08735 [bacterium]|nr:hypothetical protein [bacterium]